MIDGPTLVALLGFLGVALTAILVFARGRGDSKLKLNEYIDNRIETQLKEAYERITVLEGAEKARSGAITRILRAIANQWPVTIPGPLLDPADIEAIEETIPTQWIKKPSTPKE
jgi:hypothetical protein